MSCPTPRLSQYQLFLGFSSVWSWLEAQGYDTCLSRTRPGFDRSITFWKASPVCKKAKRNREHVSMQTCTYFCFPISRQCVTSICQSWFGTRPQGVTPRYGTGESRIHSGHCFTIIHACSLEILWQSLKVWVDKWNLLWSISLGYKRESRGHQGELEKWSILPHALCHVCFSNPRHPPPSAPSCASVTAAGCVPVVIVTNTSSSLTPWYSTPFTNLTTHFLALGRNPQEGQK